MSHHEKSLILKGPGATANGLTDTGVGQK